MSRTANIPSGAGSIASWRDKKGEGTSPKNRHNNTKSLGKEHLCQHYYLATSPSWLSSMILFQYSNTEHIATLFQEHCSLKLPAGWTLKRSCLIYKVGQPKGAMQRKAASLGSAPSLSSPLPLILVLCERPRVSSQKILLEYNQAWTQRRFETRGPNFLLDDPNFTARALLRWRLPELCLPPDKVWFQKQLRKDIFLIVCI